jgi:GLPGLI family protein
MKKTIILIIVFYCSLIYSQSGKITYGVIINTDNYKVEDNIKVIYEKIIKQAKNHKFELIFNPNYSSFKSLKKIETMTDEDLKFEKISKSALTSRSDIYYDKINKFIISDIDNTLIKEHIDQGNWKILNETKKIGIYDCYKATLIIEFLTRSGEKSSREVTAWFSPSIPYNYGPKNFNGLPGLILELTEKNTTYVVEKIEISDDNIKIVFPKGKTITKEEYEKKIKAQMGM